MDSTPSRAACDFDLSRRDRVRTIALGAACHTTFLVAITTMIVSLHEGLQLGLGRLAGRSASIANAALALSFPLLHSWLLTGRGARLLDRLFGDESGRLRTTSYALVASLQLLFVFVLWSPSDRELWRAQGNTRFLFEMLFAASWLLLARAMYDAGLAIQTGWLGWSEVARGRIPRFKPFPTQGLFRFTRQPVYLAFVCTLWSSPVLTLDGVLLGVVWTLYCLVGPLHKESRILAREPVRYAHYRARVPYFLPFIPRPLRSDGGSRCE